MTWKSHYDFPFLDLNKTSTPVGSFRVNENCFIRKQHKCGKVFAASKSCFIACPTDGEIDTILELMSEKLTKVGIEPIIAVKERAYGQDIFCTKICGKIIEARFCIVILDDTIMDGRNTPNPNVYYEYGLMTAVRKHIIPLQKDGLKLAFNIQSYDTIKYNNKNIGSELDRGIRDAIRITETQDKQEDKESFLPEKRILHRLEISGFKLKDMEWFLADAIDDTDFKGFGQHDKHFYLYLGKIDTPKDFSRYLEDLDIVLYRTEKKAQELSDKIDSIEKRKRALKEDKSAQEEQGSAEESKGMGIVRRRRLPYDEAIKRIESELAEATSKQDLMSTFFIGFIINPQLNSDDFVRRAEEMVKGYQRYQLTYSRGNEIAFGDIMVSLAERGQ